MALLNDRDVPVLIVGAGPTGLVLALWLTRLGVRVRIIDETAEPGTTSRALAVQVRTLEFYQQIGLADDLAKRGCQVSSVASGQAGKNGAVRFLSATWERALLRFPTH